MTTSPITTVEVHAEGEPGRVITGGLPPIPGATVFDKMVWMRENADHIRRLMLREPRGHPALCCNALVEPSDPRADAGVIIMEQTEYPPMSGSNVICTVTALLETGLLPMVEPVTELGLETPAWLVRVQADCRAGKVTRVRFRNVPAFAVHLDVPLELAGHGAVPVDIAWGGMFFVIAEAASLGLDPDARNGAEIVRLSETLRRAAAEQYAVAHPENPRITGPTIAQVTAPPTRPDAQGRSVVTVSNSLGAPAGPGALPGALDRSPCGTGTCAKLACLHARGRIGPGQDYVNEGPLGTTFTARIEGVTRVGPHPAIVPSLAGQGWIYGTTAFTLDPGDPFPEGYRPGDIWG